MEILYQVVIENQKIRTDLLKWKLILSAALASIGLGASSVPSVHTLPRLDIVLCCIPFVAAYVDLMCSHVSLRVQVIGKFVRLAQFNSESEKSLNAYERFVEVARDKNEESNHKMLSAWALEKWAIYASSWVLCGLVCVYGVFVAWEGGGVTLVTAMRASWFWLSGGIGAALVYGILRSYDLRYKAINNVSKDVFEDISKV